MTTPAVPLRPSGSSDQSGPPTWHEAVLGFKRRLIEHTLRATGGNRTRAARALGLQRTYLLRLIRALGVIAPSPQRPHGNVR